MATIKRIKSIEYLTKQDWNFLLYGLEYYPGFEGAEQLRKHFNLLSPAVMKKWNVDPRNKLKRPFCWWYWITWKDGKTHIQLKGKNESESDYIKKINDF